jgi:hypothetical protein
MERYELHGVRVYQLNICEATGDHHLRPGITGLPAGDFGRGMVARKCPAIRSLRAKYRNEPSVP